MRARVGWLAVVVAFGLALAACPKDKGSVEGKHEAPVVAPIVIPPPVQPPFEVPPPTDAIVSLGRFWAHACVVRASGVVDCWGNPEDLCFGNECPARPAQTGAPWRATGVTDAVTIDAHGHCVLRRTGEAACLDAKARTFVTIPKLAKVSALSNTCFVVGGRVACGIEPTPEPVARVRDAVAVVEYGPIAGSKCAVTRSGHVWCSRYGGADNWVQVADLDHVDELVIASASWSSLHACARRGEQVQCFLIDDDYPDDKAGPVHAHEKVDVPHLTGARQLAAEFDELTFVVEGVLAGKVVRWREQTAPVVSVVPVLADAVQHVFGCAVRAQGSVVCWGTNRSGVLGQPTTLGEQHVPPTTVASLRDVVDIAIGTTKGFALTRAGQVVHWGSRTRDPLPRAELMEVGAGPTLLVQLEADDSDQVCMRSANGLVWCETGARYDAPLLVQVETSSVQSIATGNGNLIAIRADGTVEQHRIHTYEYASDDPVAVRLASTNVVDASTGTTTCLRKRDGSVSCDREPAYTDATAIAVADEFDCAVKAGHVWCRPFSPEYLKPPLAAVEITGLAGVTDLSAGQDTACAVHTGAVSCWRFSETFGAPFVVIATGVRDVELGAASLDTLAASRQLHGPRPAGETGCALMLDGTVQCWGANFYGEIGDGSLVSSEIPIAVKL